MADNALATLWKEAGYIDIMGRQVDRVNGPKRCVSMYMQPAYDDFRMYMANYYLYLPFVGIVNLDAEKYLLHTMSVDLIFDIRTGNLKYNILSDNVLMDSFAGSVRVNMPVSGGSPLQAAQYRMAGMARMAFDTSKAVGSGGATLVEDGNTMAKGLFNLIKPTPKGTQGQFSPSTAIKDSLHIYLMVETPEIYYGDGIEERYGYPDNRFVSIGSCTGYVEIADVELNTSATESEQEEIKSLLMGGIVV